MKPITIKGIAHYNTKQAAEYTGFAENTFRKYANLGMITPTIICGRKMWAENKLKRMMGESTRSYY